MKSEGAIDFLRVWLMVSAAALVMLMGCSSSPDMEAPVATPQPHPGQQAFALICATCHGVNGEGQPDWHIRKPDGILPAPPLNGEGHTWHHGDGLLYRVVRDGGQMWEDPDIPQFRSGMPGLGGQLSHEEIVDVIEYVKSLWVDKEVRGVSIIEHQALMSESDPFPPSAQ